METTIETPVIPTERLQSCAICGTKDNLMPVITNAYNRTCESHKEYAGHFQLDKVRVALGYLDKIPDADCELCGKHLSVDELNSIGDKDFSKTCDEHRWLAWIASGLHQFKDQYKAGSPFIFVHNGFVYSEKIDDAILFLKLLGEKQKVLVYDEHNLLTDVSHIGNDKIDQFILQNKIEIRRVIPIDKYGNPISSIECSELMNRVLNSGVGYCIRRCLDARQLYQSVLKEKEQ